MFCLPMGVVLKHELASGVIAIQDGMIDDLILAPFSKSFSVKSKNRGDVS